MNHTLALILVVVVLLVLLAAGLPVMFTLIGSAITGFLLYLPPEHIEAIGPTLWNNANAPVLAAVPLFILMGELFVKTTLSAKAFAGIARTLSGVPGGLVHAAVPASTLFAAASGSSVATLATISRIAGPALQERGYPNRLYMGAQAAGGTLGILIPPSIAMILYGVLSGTSIGDLFIAGIIPGLILAALISGIVTLLSVTKYRGQLPTEPSASLRDRATGLAHTAPILVVAIVVLGSIYFGIATPTESASLGVLIVLLLGFFGGGLTVAKCVEAVRHAAQFSAMLMMILVTAGLLAYIFAIGGAANVIADIAGAIDNQYLLLALIAVIFLIMGTALESAALMAIALPLILPAVEALQIDPIVFGIFVVINMEIDLLAPPGGLNLFVLKSVYPDASWSDIFRSVVPYVFLMFGFLVFLVLVPEIATWLPSVLK